MSTWDDANEFLMSTGAKAFPFENVGDAVTGTIVSMQKRQQTDMQTGKPAYWDNGDPKMMLMVTLQTELQDDDEDDGVRTVYLRGGNHTAVSGTGTSSLNAVRDAVKRSKSAAGIQDGATLTLSFTGIGKASSKGFNPPKLYTATYKAPTYAVDLDEMA